MTMMHTKGTADKRAAVVNIEPIHGGQLADKLPQGVLASGKPALHMLRPSECKSGSAEPFSNISGAVFLAGGNRGQLLNRIVVGAYIQASRRRCQHKAGCQRDSRRIGLCKTL